MLAKASLWRKYRADDGFSLVEVLASLALLSLLSVFAFGGVRFAFSAWERAQVHALQLDSVFSLQDFLRRVIEEAYPAFVGSTPHGRVDFQGEPTALHLLAPTPAALGGGGRSRMTLTVQVSETSSELVLISVPELTASAQAQKTSLLKGAHSIELSYFGRRRGENIARWHESWKDQVILPELVRMSVAFAEGDKRRWPVLTMAPRVTVDVSCVYDALTQSCRGR